MFIDFNKDDIPSELNYDICIIGSGAAALAILTAFYDSKYNVLILEAGEESINDRNQKIYDVITTNHPFNSARDGRFRVFGGSTTKWGGQSLPLDRIDFIKRNWVPSSGWPISYEEVAQYYERVDNFLNLDTTDYNTDIYRLLKEAPLKYNKDLLFKFSKWSSKPNLREIFRKRLTQSKNILLVKNANLISINLNENCENVTTLTIKNFDSKEYYIKSKRYILACGGIENARLLLASNKKMQNGVGNNFDLVGRFLQDHPNAHIGTFQTNNKKAQSYFNYFYKSNTRFLPRFVVSEKFQLNKKILNASASLLFISKDDDPFTLAKEVYRKYIRGELTKSDLNIIFRLLKHLPEMFEIGKHLLINKKVYTPDSTIKINLMMETPPLWNNRITLSQTINDALGMPKAIISWKINELVIRTLKECASLLKFYLDQSNIGLVELPNWLINGDWDDKINDAKHHIGTTRMGNSFNEGVVDLNCKVFNIDNLYIAGSSVFPTSGHSNPTSTIIALAFRLSDHIKSLK